MAGHNKWKQIKDKKAKTDQGRGKLFSKLANVISIAARENPDPKFNPSLRQAIDQAKKHNMPAANIDRAINRVGEGKDLEELLIEAYGPEGVGLLVEAITDNRNRTIAEIKNIFKDFNAKMAEPGALMWAFEKSEGEYLPKFPTATPENVFKRVSSLVDALEDHPDVGAVYTSLQK
ncbi:MAG: YebC/PmpR family DNA-binding transcriptional regulator [Candidatus Colwellbacteria bacterium]